MGRKTERVAIRTDRYTCDVEGCDSYEAFEVRFVREDTCFSTRLEDQLGSEVNEKAKEAGWTLALHGNIYANICPNHTTDDLEEAQP